jgi:polyferredoxin
MPEKTPSYKRKHPIMWLRYAVLGGLLIYVSYVGYMHLQHQTVYPPVDAICPFGGLASLYSIVFHGEFLQRIFISSFILLGITVLLVAVSGRSFCGWICPLGTLQGLMAGVGRKVFGVKQRLDTNRDGRWRWLRWPILVIFTLGAWYGGKLLIRPYDPWVAWMHIWEIGEVLEEFPIGLAVLVLTFVAGIFIARPFCRYLCPMGIFLGALNKGSAVRLRVSQESCIHCMACDRKCPVGIPIESSTVVSSTECISCGECVPVCPVPDTLYFTMGQKRRLSPTLLGVTVVVVFFGVLGVTKATGIYHSTPPSAEHLAASGKQITPDEIRGYMTLGGIAELFDLELDSLYAHLGLDRAEVSPYAKAKEIGKVTGSDFETDSVRVVVARMIDVARPAAGCPETSGASDEGPTILGTHTLREVAQNADIDLVVLYGTLGLDSTAIPPDTPCRELKNLVDPSFHTSVVREAVAELKEGAQDR